jgi:hypothetical protein
MAAGGKFARNVVCNGVSQLLDPFEGQVLIANLTLPYHVLHLGVAPVFGPAQSGCGDEGSQTPAFEKGPTTCAHCSMGCKELDGSRLLTMGNSACVSCDRNCWFHYIARCPDQDSIAQAQNGRGARDGVTRVCGRCSRICDTVYGVHTF